MRHAGTGGQKHSSQALSEFLVSEEFSGLRLDQVLAELAGISRTQAASLIKAGRAGVSGHGRVAPAFRVVKGDLVFADVAVSHTQLEPVKMELDVVYEDSDVAVVCKPAGIPVHPAPSIRGPTLVSGFVSRWPHINGVGAPDRPGIVHRLDQDVSGLMVVAMSTQAYSSLSGDFLSRRVSRRYIALVAGILEADTGRIEGPIGRDPSDPTKRAVVLGGKSAATNYTRLAHWRAVSLCEIALDTGRTHQIRVHMQAIGHPVCGDPIYGPKNKSRIGRDELEAVGILTRPFLHSYRLEFEHPVSKEQMKFESGLPRDLKQALEALGPPVWGSVEEIPK